MRGRRTKEREAQREEMQRQEAPWWQRKKRRGGWLVGARVRDVDTLFGMIKVGGIEFNSISN